MAERIVDMSNAVHAAAFLNELKRLRGMYRVDIKRFRQRRSDRQNRYYWPCFVQPFAGFLRDQGENVTADQCHEMLRHKFLCRSVTDHKTGEALEFTASTTLLDTAEFNDYLDRCAHWLADMFGIIVPDPAAYHEQTATD